MVSALKVSDVFKNFREVQALNGVSFDIFKGELFFLLGPSGCGKTTMLRILAGLEEANSGAIYFSGEDVRKLPAYKRGAPMVFQNYALWPHMTVYANIAFGLQEQKLPKKVIEKKVNEILELVNLVGLANRTPGELSGGQQQRVVLARALVLNPDIILLDEPLSNLDAKLRHEMRHEIQELHKNTDITFVYVTHDQLEALSLADRIAVMDKGKIMSLGNPADLYHHPDNYFCATFLGEANFIEGTVIAQSDNMATIDSEHGQLKANANGLQLSAGEKVKLLMRPENIDIRSASQEECNVIENCLVEDVSLNGSTISIGLAKANNKFKVIDLNRLPIDIASDDEVSINIKFERTIVIKCNNEER
ncbi:MAG: ABC transporter ATP-binding protein [Kiritimatiellae bacterium]|jgi:iron(III) transport system ATP-binding protein|nr:ABC transporter ATP-binding protein [Kiritimatiellia bacterium]